MKFYKVLCQFVKISTLFTESWEKGLDKVFSRGEKNFSVHKRYMNFLRPRKTALDEPLYKLSAGRSMVEMLGVLAIIGVLSVGAIAGYSKAMMKYKLNKQAEQFTSLFSTIFSYDNAFGYPTGSTAQNMLPILKKLNAIPEDMLMSGDDVYIYDVFKNKIRLNAINEVDYNSKYYQISYSLANSTDFSVANCRNIIISAKAYSEYIYQIISGNINFGRIKYVGDEYCDPSRACLKDITLQQIDEMCRTCINIEENCSLIILWERTKY